MQKALFIPEINGMRVVAATVVLLAHFTGNIGLSGVGLFFIITGFLSGTKIKRAIANGVVLNFWPDLRNSIWRIFLPMSIVLFATFLWVVTSVDILLRAEWLQSLTMMTLGFGNFYELANATSYWNRSSISSPSLHLWAMSVLIQFAILLGLIRYFVSRIAPKISEAARKQFIIVFGVVVIGLTIFDSMNFDWTTNYHFSTLNWAWAFLLGLFLGGVNWTLPNKSVARWSADIVFFALLIIGFLPLIGINPLGNWVRAGAAVLAVICLSSPQTVLTFYQKVLNSKPIQFLGNITYEIYLIHWPLLIAFRYYTDENRNRTIPGVIAEGAGSAVTPLNWISGIGLAALTILLAWLLKKLVDFLAAGADALRDPKRIITQALAVAMLPLLIFIFQGSNVRPADDVYKNLVPEISTANRDTPSYMTLSCGNGIVRICTHGAEDAEQAVVIVGTSTAGQWFDAVIPTADKYDWKIQTMIKEGCIHPQDRMVNFCATWREEVVKQLISQKPDLVIMETSHANLAATQEQVAKIDQEILQPLVAAGIKVMGIRSTPRFDFFVPECISANPDFQNVCAIDASSFYLSEEQYQADIDPTQFVEIADLTEIICPDGKCSPVSGNIIRYVDDKHLTRTFATSLAGDLEPYILRALN